MLYVVKRDGRKAKFDINKIFDAISGAANDEGVNFQSVQISETVNKVVNYIKTTEKQEITVEEIQNLVEKALKESNHSNIAVAYSNYRRERTKIRDIKSDLMKELSLNTPH